MQSLHRYGHANPYAHKPLEEPPAIVASVCVPPRAIPLEQENLVRVKVQRAKRGDRAAKARRNARVHYPLQPHATRHEKRSEVDHKAHDQTSDDLSIQE